MKIRLLLVACATALSNTAAAQQPQADAADWNISRNADAGLTAASIEFTNGITVVARCRQGVYDLLVAGLPAAPERTLTRQLSLIVGEDLSATTRQSSWTVGGNTQIAFSRIPALTARQLAEGGKLQIVVPGEDGGRNTRYVMELGPSASALEETLTACGRPLDDPRDDEIEDDVEAGLGPNGPLVWVRAPRGEFPEAVRGRVPTQGYATLSCRAAADGGLTDCQVESEQPAGFNLAREALDSTRRARVALSSEAEGAGARLEGRVLVFSVNFRLAD